MSGSERGLGPATSAAGALTSARQAHPRVGLQSTPARCWSPGRALRPDIDLHIVEDHGGFALGGNKVRHLDLILGGAEAQAGDVWLTAAGAHSNLCRVLSAAGALFGRQVHLILRGEASEQPTGNQIVYALSGASITWVQTADPFGAAQDEAASAAVDHIRATGRTPFLVDVRETHAPLSALAETGLLDEVEDQLDGPPDCLVVPAGAGSTAAGLWVALAARNWHTRLLAVSVNVAAPLLEARIERIAHAAADLAGLDPATLAWPPLQVSDRFIGPAYGVATPEGWAAIHRTAAHTGLLLDPTYTGKAMAALLDEAPSGRVVFVHTGGTPALFHHPLPEPEESAS